VILLFTSWASAVTAEICINIGELSEIKCN